MDARDAAAAVASLQGSAAGSGHMTVTSARPRAGVRPARSPSPRPLPFLAVELVVRAARTSARSSGELTALADGCRRAADGPAGLAARRHARDSRQLRALGAAAPRRERVRRSARSCCVDHVAGPARRSHDPRRHRRRPPRRAPDQRAVRRPGPGRRAGTCCARTSTGRPPSCSDRCPPATRSWTAFAAGLAGVVAGARRGDPGHQVAPRARPRDYLSRRHAAARCARRPTGSPPTAGRAVPRFSTDAGEILRPAAAAGAGVPAAGPRARPRQRPRRRRPPADLAAPGRRPRRRRSPRARHAGDRRRARRLHAGRSTTTRRTGCSRAGSSPAGRATRPAGTWRRWWSSGRSRTAQLTTFDWMTAVAPESLLGRNDADPMVLVRLG